ncbi:hypothetical protein PA05_1783 [Cutibacterium acnes P05]|nr:hypothetical protein [Cutibacterium acnes P05]
MSIHYIETGIRYVDTYEVFIKLHESSSRYRAVMMCGMN